jgi:hypothetical protein
MKRFAAIVVAAGLSFILSDIPAVEQSSPNLVTGQVPTAGQWNSFFQQKQDVLNFSPLNRAGDTMTGKLNITPALTTSAGLNIPQGSAPASPTNGDIWTTSSGMFAQIGGSTIGPFGVGGTAAAGGSSGQLQYNNGGSLGGFTMIGDCTIAQPSITCTKINGATAGNIFALNVGSGLASGGGQLSVSFPITAANGGTGVNNGANTLSLAQAVTFSGGGPTTITAGGTANSTLPNGTHSLAALDLADQTVSGGANVTTLANSTGNITIDCGARPTQSITNGGAFTITAPANDGSCLILVTNNASAGAITFSGFTVGSSIGDSLTTTNTSKFTISIWRIGGTSGYRIAAHQ